MRSDRFKQLGAIFAIVLFVTVVIGTQVAEAKSVKKIEVADGGFGAFTCSYAFATEEQANSISVGIAGINIDVTVDKNTGKMSGTWLINSSFVTDPIIASGQISDGKIRGDSFTLNGIAAFVVGSGATSNCGPMPIPITIVGQCGEDVTLTLRGDKQDFASAQTLAAGFGGVSVTCLK